LAAFGQYQKRQWTKTGRNDIDIIGPRILAILLLLAGSVPVQAEAAALAPAPSPGSAPESASVPGSGNIEFVDRDKGGAGEKLSLDALKAVAPPVSLEVFEPHEGRKRTYRALPAWVVFDAIFGNKWKKAKEMVFLSTDGYRAAVPVVKFIEHDGYLAFEHDDGSPFRMINKLQHDELAQLGPLYLVWDNLNSKALLESGASDMPYQIRVVEIKSSSSLPGMVPPAGASPRAQQGFAHFRKYCAACHAINGEGGTKGPELNYPVSVTEYIQPAYLKRWIENPQGIRYNTTMPGLAKGIPRREQVTEELIAYLEAMSAAKRDPAKQNDRPGLERLSPGG
jgi:cytochrome c2